MVERCTCLDQRGLSPLSRSNWSAPEGATTSDRPPALSSQSRQLVRERASWWQRRDGQVVLQEDVDTVDERAAEYRSRATDKAGYARWKASAAHENDVDSEPVP